jgi:hypothetical protein
MAALLTMLLAMCGACSSEEEEILAAAEDVESTDSLMTVTFQTGVPVDSDAVLTRSAGDGKKADVLYYILYNGEGTKIIDTNVGGTPIAVRSNKTAAVEFRVNPGKTYHVVFWAQSSELSVYTLNAYTMTMTMPDYSTIPVNDDRYDAFFYTGEFTPHRGTPIESITLKRPFTLLKAAIKTSYITAGTYKQPYYATIYHDAYTTLNLWTGRATGYQTFMHFKYNYVDNDYDMTVTNSKNYPGDYTFVAFGYALADTETLYNLVADFNYYDSSMSYVFDALDEMTSGVLTSTLKRNARVTMYFH